MGLIADFVRDRRRKRRPPPLAVTICVLLGSIATIVGSYTPWARTAPHGQTILGSDSGGTATGTVAIAALALALVIRSGRRWPALPVLVLGAFATATTAYYLVDVQAVAGDANAATLHRHVSIAWGLYLAFAGSLATSLGALAISPLRRRSRPVNTR